MGRWPFEAAFTEGKREGACQCLEHADEANVRSHSKVSNHPCCERRRPEPRLSRKWHPRFRTASGQYPDSPCGTSTRVSYHKKICSTHLRACVMQRRPPIPILRMNIRLLRKQICDNGKMSVQCRLVQRGLQQPYDASTEYLSPAENSNSTRSYLALLVLDIRDRTALLHDFGARGNKRRSDAWGRARRHGETRTPFHNIQPPPARGRVQRGQTGPGRCVICKLERLHVICADGLPELRLDASEVSRGCGSMQRLELGRRRMALRRSKRGIHERVGSRRARALWCRLCNRWLSFFVLEIGFSVISGIDKLFFVRVVVHGR